MYHSMFAFGNPPALPPQYKRHFWMVWFPSGDLPLLRAHPPGRAAALHDGRAEPGGRRRLRLSLGDAARRLGEAMGQPRHQPQPQVCSHKCKILF